MTRTMKEVDLLALDMCGIREPDLNLVTLGIEETLKALQLTTNSILVGAVLPSSIQGTIIDSGIFEGKIPFYIKSVSVRKVIIDGGEYNVFSGMIVPIGEVGDIIEAERFGMYRREPFFIPIYSTVGRLFTWHLNLHFTTEEKIKIEDNQVALICKSKILKYFKPELKPLLLKVVKPGDSNVK